MTRVQAEPTITHISKNRLFVYVEGSSKDIALDTILCFYQISSSDASLLPHACGVVVLSANENAIVLIQTISDKSIQAGDRLVKHETMPGHLNMVDGGKKKTKRTERVFFVADNAEYVLSTIPPGTSISRGDEVCYYWRQKPIGCSKVQLSSRKYALARPSDKLKKEMKMGLRVTYVKRDRSKPTEEERQLWKLRIPGKEQEEKPGDNTSKLRKEFADKMAAREAQLKKSEKRRLWALKKLREKATARRFGGHATLALMSPMRYRILSYKTIGASDTTTASIWERSGSSTPASFSLDGEFLQRYSGSIYWLIGMQLDVYKQSKRTSLVDEFRPQLIGNTSIKASGQSGYLGFQYYTLKAIGGQAFVRFSLYIQKSQFSFEASAYEAVTDQYLSIVQLHSTRYGLAIALPFGFELEVASMAWQVIAIPMLTLAQTGPESNVLTVGPSYVDQTNEARKDLEDKLSYSSSNFSLNVGLGVLF